MASRFLALSMTCVVLGGALRQAPPPFPQSCNETYLQFNSWWAYVGAPNSYENENAGCLADFTACLASTPTPDSCVRPCLSGADSVSSTCGLATDTFCTITAQNAAPVDPGLPPFRTAYDLCLPNQMAPSPGCGPSQLPALTSYWAYTLCGPTFFNSPDCLAAVQINCQFDTSAPFDPTALIWGILATFGVGGLGAMVYFRRRKAQDEAMGLSSGDYFGGEWDADADDVEGGLAAPLEHAGSASGGDRTAPSRLTGSITVASMPPEGGTETETGRLMSTPGS
jgi:hypothetical protein